MNRLKKGFTIVELLVVVSIISLLIAILLPAIGRARDAALITQSLGNLRNMSAACNAYGADYNDRQFTACPDDLGQYGATPQAAFQEMMKTQCVPQMILGWDNDGGLWGYWIGGSLPRCQGFPAGGGFNLYIPCWYWTSNAVGKPGSWRVPNVKAFNQYVSGRFYDKVYWAPKDRLSYEPVEKWFQNPVEFNYDGGDDFREPTYCWSPAAMWSPSVMSWTRAVAASGSSDCCAVKLGGAPSDLPGAYKSPTASLAQYPSLKWRQWEHQWLQNVDGGDTNPCFNLPTPWFYNLGYNSAPCVLYFDGHTQMVSVSGCMQDNDLACSQGKPLYYCSITEANDGYYAACAFDMLTNSNPCRPFTAGFATVDGILGRDQIRLGD